MKIMSKANINKLNSDARAFADSQPTETHHDSLVKFLYNSGLECTYEDQTCEIWTDPATDEMVNVWTDGVQSELIEDGGLGFDDNVEWYTEAE